MRILVLGGYGLIGGAITTALLAAGHDVTGLGRSVAMARSRWPQARWLACDLQDLANREAWLPLLDGIEAVVNAAGVLQDGPGDDVAKVQASAMIALFAACAEAGVSRVVQISAAGAAADASTLFMRSKAQADAALKASSLDWIILRPGLVIGAPAYGGTAMLRGLAALPGLIPLPAGTPTLQTVALDDVSAAAVGAVEGRVPSRRSYDLLEERGHSLAVIVAALRASLGFAPARLVEWPLPLFRLCFRLGDLAGWLGWRSPMRTTALIQIEGGISGDPRPWIEATGRPLRSLPETLAALPSSVQERWFARLFLLKPMIIVTLASFWLASGLIGLWQREAAEAVLVTRGVAPWLAEAFVLAGALLDIALGAAMLRQRTMAIAAFGMIAVTAGYLAAGTVLTPGLWVDPLGPFVKTLPAALLALVALAVREGR